MLERNAYIADLRTNRQGNRNQVIVKDVFIEDRVDLLLFMYSKENVFIINLMTISMNEVACKIFLFSKLFCSVANIT